MNSDLKTLIEENTSLKCYPFIIPETAEYPSILYLGIGFRRNNDSNLSESNVLDRKFQLVAISKTVKETKELEIKLTNLLEGWHGTIGTTKILITRINNVVDLYNHNQGTFECNIDVEFTIKN